MFLLLHNNAWQRDFKKRLSIPILHMFASLVSIHSKMWIQQQTSYLHQRLVSLAWYWCYGGSYLFQKYLFLHSRSLNSICTVYPLSTLLASLPLFLFVLQYQNLKLAKSASKLLEKQIECKTHNTKTKGISFLFRIFSKKRNLERSLFVLTPFSYKLKFQRTPMPSDAIYRVWAACGAPLILIPRVFNRKLIKLAICYQDHQNTRK